jgi:hypothetical protein
LVQGAWNERTSRQSRYQSEGVRSVNFNIWRLYRLLGLQCFIDVLPNISTHNCHSLPAFFSLALCRSSAITPNESALQFLFKLFYIATIKPNLLVASWPQQ